MEAHFLCESPKSFVHETEICKFAIMRKNDAFVAKIVNTRLTKGFMAIFAPAESLPSPATLLHVVTTGAYYPPVVTTWKILTTGAS